MAREPISIWIQTHDLILRCKNSSLIYFGFYDNSINKCFKIDSN